jgi:radical SAM superfamily enzyme YgiQ (UPF0313 family)
MPLGEAPPPPEEEVVKNAAILPRKSPPGPVPPAEDEEKPKIPPPQDKYDLMTQLELLEQVIIKNEPAKIKLVVKILGLNKEEAIWRRLFAGLKYGNMDVFRLIHKDVKPSELGVYINYCRKAQNDRVMDYLRGLDPDAEPKKKKKKGRLAKK